MRKGLSIKNIEIVNGKPQFGNNCLACYACLHICPQNALHKKNEKCTTRFRNENVTIGEIIAANEQ